MHDSHTHGSSKRRLMSLPLFLGMGCEVFKQDENKINCGYPRTNLLNTTQRLSVVFAGDIRRSFALNDADFTNASREIEPLKARHVACVAGYLHGPCVLSLICLQDQSILDK